MSYTTAVDLGKRKAGVAVFSGLELVHAATVRMGPPCSAERMAKLIQLEGLVGGPAPHTWVVELPEKYRGHGAKDRALDSLLAVYEALTALVGPCTEYTPHDWKGHVPKAVMVARLQRPPSLLPDWAQGLGHDALDAVGLGYVHLGVTGRGCAR
jgi:hypothetical protein